MGLKTESKIKFVGLHAHSGMSLNDGLGYPQDHMDFAYENGMDALALTDHGHMNGLAYQVLHAQKMKKEGKTFKPIFGVEAYFLPSLQDWKAEYDKVSEQKKSKKSGKKTRTFAKRKLHGTGTNSLKKGSMGSEQLKAGLASKYKSLKKGDL